MDTPLSPRDRDYIETRLLSWPGVITEASERLRKLGRTDDADLIMAAAKVLNDICRDVRLGLR